MIVKDNLLTLLMEILFFDADYASVCKMAAEIIIYHDSHEARPKVGFD